MTGGAHGTPIFLIIRSDIIEFVTSSLAQRLCSKHKRHAFHESTTTLQSRGVAAGRAGRAIALPIFWQETAVTVTS